MNADKKPLPKPPKNHSTAKNTKERKGVYQTSKLIPSGSSFPLCFKGFDFSSLAGIVLSVFIRGEAFASLPCCFIQQNRCRYSGVERLHARRVWDRYQFIGQRENFLWHASAFIAHHDHRRAGEVSFMQRLAFVR